MDLQGHQVIMRRPFYSRDFESAHSGPCIKWTPCPVIKCDASRTFWICALSKRCEATALAHVMRCAVAFCLKKASCGPTAVKALTLRTPRANVKYDKKCISGVWLEFAWETELAMETFLTSGWSDVGQMRRNAGDLAAVISIPANDRIA